MIRCVIFDADKVVINNEYVPVHLEKEYGISQELTQEFFAGVFKDCVIGRKDIKDVLPSYLNKWGWKKTLDEFLLYWYTVEDIVNEDLMHYIQNLRENGIICCLATNQEKYRFQYMLDEMGFDKAFDHIYTSSILGVKKPDKAFYKLVVENLGIAKEDTLFWDDAEKNVTAAKEFGIHAELYTSFPDFMEKMKKYIL